MTTKQDRPAFTIGIDLGGTLIKSALVSASGAVEAFGKEPTKRGDSGALMDQLAGIAERLRRDAHDAEVQGLGIGVPGNVDARSKEILASPNLPFTVGVNMERALRERVGMTPCVDNDGNAGAVGEHRFGAGRGALNLVYLCLGTGVGGGLILDGRLYRGSQGYAGELGHTNVHPDGLVCRCGAKGCLEMEAAAPAVVRRAKARLASGAASRLSSIEGRDVTSEDVGRLAADGDEVCIDALRETGKMLGIALAGFLNIFNPDVIVIGGGVALSGDLLLEPAVNEAGARAFRSPFEHCRFRLSELKNMAGVVGAAALAMGEPPTKEV